MYWKIRRWLVLGQVEHKLTQVPRRLRMLANLSTWEVCLRWAIIVAKTCKKTKKAMAVIHNGIIQKIWNNRHISKENISRTCIQYTPISKQVIDSEEER